MRIKKYIKALLLTYLLIQQSTDGISQHRQPDKMQFTRLTTANGLSQSTINAIIKDKTGFMWFGTTDGLNKFDGYKFKIYRNIPGDSTSIPYNLIKTLFVDNRGTLWIGTLGGGLARYDEKSDTFQRFDIGLIQRIFEDRLGKLWIATFDGLFIVNRKTGKAERAELFDSKYKILRKKIITSILEDKKKNLWIGTINGLYLIPAISGKTTLFFNVRNGRKSNSSEINAITMDQKGQLWVGTRAGLYQYNEINKNFLPARFSARQGEKPSQAAINSLFCDSDNIIWIGTDHGLGRYNPDQATYQLIVNDAYDVHSLSRNSVNAIYADKQILWIGTALGGVNKYDKNTSFVSHYKIYNRNNQKANTNVVTSFAENLNGEYWIGTDGGGLFSWNPFSNTFTPFGDINPGASALGQSILCLQKSRDGQSLWIGTYNQGLFRFNIKTKKLSRFYSGNHMLKDNSVYAILEDKKSNIWVGTNGGGVSVINPNGVAVIQLTNDQPNALTNNYVRALMEDQKGRIWIGTYGGLNIFDPYQHKFVALPNEAFKLTKHQVCAFFIDAGSKVWVGTQGAGLFIYDQQKRKLLSLTEQNGLTNNNISSVIPDTKGFVWISTSRGMNRLPKDGDVFDSFVTENGMQTNEFTGGAGYTSYNRDLFFGSVEGFSLFRPLKYNKNAVVPSVVITDFQLHTNPLSSRIEKVPKFNVNDGIPVSLNPDQSVFTIEFAALNYSSTEKNKYACMLEGFEKEWQYTGYERKVTYNNLPPGEYLFRVKGTNNDGIWNHQGTSLKIIIRPPLWRTGWAYLLYSLATIYIAYSIFKELKERERLKNELRFQKLTSEKIEELNQLKLNFFTNISHELRTPLSLIIDPLRRISQDEINLDVTKSLSALAFRHASRLLTLVNQLLDFRKFEGSLKLEPLPVNIRDLIQDIVLSFKEQANKRKLELSSVFHLEFDEVCIDPDKFQKIITNLISNAFKFTPDEGRVTLTTSTFTDENEKKQMEIRLQDTGPGIPEAYKSRIFDMLFQIEDTPRFEMESSGIGLALVKELVQLHNGQIFEQGEKGEGALFILTMPIPMMISRKISKTYKADEGSDPSQFALKDHESAWKDVNNNEITILIIEDNDELRKYIAWNLSAYYEVEEASNGQEGYQKAIALIPNLIVSDVMMKNGDGLELCKQVKNNEKTSHIPIILLTAKQADNSKIQGYKSGADAYISKPFNSDLLRTRIANLLESRQKLLTVFPSTSSEDPAEQQKLTELDQEFLHKVANLVIANFLEANFDVEELARMLRMTRRQLSRKLKAVTDQTPQEYIIQVRLKTAIEFMLHQDMNISQAAYEVGFSEPANFSRSFSKVYGQSPKNYLKEKFGKKTL